MNDPTTNSSAAYACRAIDKIARDFKDTVDRNACELKKATEAVTDDGWNLYWMDNIRQIYMNNAGLTRRTISTSMTTLRQIDG